jgi:hypothetical protein
VASITRCFTSNGVIEDEIYVIAFYMDGSNMYKWVEFFSIKEEMVHA